ncbi:hypothetical protein RRG08_051613 [Elysia crispata]|uniref:Uncharacterized protein n=1 Tax=Elysia crispata TaxID=231223 RepID=A0AAE1DRZ4_9GAST|nr:hypothetical protein RRG08_051613 [Elysia crispata]
MLKTRHLYAPPQPSRQANEGLGLTRRRSYYYPYRVRSSPFNIEVDLRFEPSFILSYQATAPGITTGNPHSLVMTGHSIVTAAAVEFQNSHEVKCHQDKTQSPSSRPPTGQTSMFEEQEYPALTSVGVHGSKWADDNVQCIPAVRHAVRHTVRQGLVIFER